MKRYQTAVKIMAFLVFGLTMHSRLFAQFHTLKIPKASQTVVETQTLGVTDITVTYGSPAIKGRNVWKDLVPQGGNPIAWRAGANLATTISFSTDVMIEGQSLAAGEYGFHIIPENENYTLLFVQPSQQWGSYYLDIDKDTILKVIVNSESCAKSEQLDYEFLNRTENSLSIGLEWDKKRIPFRVEVDLNKTVVESFRNELRGINTYHWQAWNDAALWCLEHNTNLEEALQWVDRSINGGYGGFAANKNLVNTSTKIRLLKKLNRLDDMNKAISSAKEIHATAYEANDFSGFLLKNGFYAENLDYCNQFFKNNGKVWFLELNRGISHYFIGNNKMALKDVRNSLKTAPEQIQSRLKEIIVEIKNKTYNLPES